ncbi:Phosphoinositide phosphatase [Arachis hypogaea]|nr:Phosphoinositide phosphatase [Arachis hypogaea]
MVSSLKRIVPSTFLFGSFVCVPFRQFHLRFFPAVSYIVPSDKRLFRLCFLQTSGSSVCTSFRQAAVPSALPSGSFVKLSISGRDFHLTIIARRSRHYAGTRYLKRGVNEKGRVANDVETEQIVFADARDGSPMKISSVVQIQGSIPLFLSQEASPLNIKSDIILSKKDNTFEATRFHFENLVKRYGNLIIILNLIKTHEKKPQETILRAKFANAVRSINKNIKGKNRLRFLHWDLHRHSRCNKATNVLTQLGKVAAYALKLTGIFYCSLTPNLTPEGPFQYSFTGAPKVEVGTRSTDASMDEWLERTAYAQSNANKSKKKK